MSFGMNSERTARASDGRKRAIRLGLSCATAFVLLAGTQASAGECPPEADDGVPETCPAEALSEVIEVEMVTTLGTIRLGLLPGVAPATVANFLSYMAAGDYDNVFFHRVFRSGTLDIIQSGAFGFDGGAFVENVAGDPICNEPCIKNERGTIAMAKLGNQPHSATIQWFINVNDSPVLDPADGAAGFSGGFTVFGRVMEGMDVVDAIAELPQTPSALLLTLYLPLDSFFSQTLAEMPLTSVLEEDPAGYGCFDTAEVGAEVDTSVTLIRPVTPILDTGINYFSWVSLGCLDPKEPQPVVLPGDDCSADGNCIEKVIFAQNRFTTYHAITPEHVARSHVGRALLREDMIEQLEDKAVYLTVPEPKALLTGLFAIATLAGLAQLKRPPLR